MTDGKDGSNGEEQFILESMENWKSLVENAPNIITMVDQNGIIKFINRTVQGLPKKEVIGKSVYDFVEPDYQEIARESIERVFKTGTPTTYESKALGPGNTISRYEVQVGPIIQKKKVVAVSLFGSDVSERKKAEEALQESEEKYRNFIEQSQEGLILLNEQGIITEWNAAQEVITGMKCEEVLGRPFWDILVSMQVEEGNIENRMDELKNMILDGIKNGKAPWMGGPHQRKIRHKGGTIRYIESLVFPISTSKGMMLGSINRDITDRKRTEEALTESEEKLRSIVESSPDAITVTDLSGKIIECNQATLDLQGYSEKEEVSGKNSFDIIAPEDRDKAYKNLEKIFKEGYLRNIEYNMLKKDGSKFQAELSVRPILDIKGEPKAFVGITKDITQRKQAEKALRESEEKFRNIVQSSPMGMHMYQLAPDGGLIFTGTNPAADRILGVDNQQFVGMTIEEAFPSLKETIVPDKYRLAAKKGEGWDTEQIDYEDEKIKGAFEVHAFQTSQDKMVTLFMDITERKQTEMKLKESEEKFRMFFQNQPEYCYMISSDGTILDVNKSALETLGYEKDELIGKSLNTIYAPENHKEMEELFEKWKKTGNLKNEEITIISKSGEKRHVLLSAESIYNESGSLLYSVSVQRDFTERKKVEEALRESESFLSESQKIAHVGSWSLDLVNNQLTWSDEVYRIFGQESQEFDATYEAFLEMVHPEDRTAVDAAYTDSLRERRDSYEIEHRVVRKHTGEIRTVHEKCIHLRDETNTIVRSVGMVQDITEYKEAEQKLRESEEKYRDLVENIDEVVYKVTKDGMVDYVSPVIESLLGYKPSEIINQPFMNFIHKDDLKKLADNIQSIYSGKIAENEYRILTKSGDIRWIHTSSKAIVTDKGVLGLQGILSDITQRKNTEERTRMLRDLGHSLSAQTDLKEAVSICIDTAINTTGMDSGGFYLVDKKTGDLNLLYSKGLSPEFIKAASFYHANSPNTQLVMSGKPSYVIYSDLQLSPSAENIPEGLQVLSVIPVIHEKKVIGCLNIASHITEEIPVSARNTLESIASQIGSTIVRLQAEEALRLSEDRYRTISELISDFVYSIRVEPDGTNVSDWSTESLEKIIGMSHDELLIQGGWKNVIHPEDLHIVVTRQKRLAEGKSDVSEYRVLSKDGDMHWVRDYADPIWDDKEGRIVRILGAAQDITAHKKAEEQSKILSSAVEQSANSIAILDKEGIVTYVNSKFLESSQLDKEKIMGKHWGAFVPPQSSLRENINEIRDTVLIKGYAWNGETSEVQRDGNTIWRTSTLFPIKDLNGNVERTVYISEDITDRKKAEKALFESKERFQNLSDLLPEAVFEIDLKGKITFANKRAFKMFGYSEEDFLSGLNTLDIFPQREKQVMKRNIERILNGENIGVNEYVVIKNDGTEFPVLIHSNAIIQEGRPIGLRGIIVDITTRKKTETEREILFRELKHRVKNNLQLLSSMVDMQIMRSDDPKLKSKLQETQSVIDTIALIYSRAYEGTEMAGLNLNIFIEELLNGLMKFKTNNELIIDYTILGDKIKLSTDSAIPMALIANELVFNSLKHAFKDRKAGRINIKLKDEKDTIAMTISDDGIGLDPKIDLDKPDSFGLKIVNNLTNQLNGTIETNLENGTEFVLRVPKVD